MTNEARSIEILLVEDNEGDVFLTKKAFAAAKILNNIHVAQDGEVAMDMLLRKPGFEYNKRPDIILLDINMPKKDGQQVLQEIKNDPNLRRIPVVMLTSSDAEHDVLQSYQLHANCYIRKPVTLENFQSVVGAIENFWFNIVELPTA